MTPLLQVKLPFNFFILSHVVFGKLSEASLYSLPETESVLQQPQYYLLSLKSE